MSTWLARLKTQNAPDTQAREPRKPHGQANDRGLLGFLAHPQGHIQKFDEAVVNPETPAANAPAIDPDRWAWPHSSAMNGQELDTLMARQALFCQRGAAPQDAERLADSLVNRDRDSDDRRLCLECRHLHGAGPYRCGNAQAAGVHADLARDLVLILQRCHGYDDARLPIGGWLTRHHRHQRQRPNHPARHPAQPGGNWIAPTWRTTSNAASASVQAGATGSAAPSACSYGRRTAA